MHAEDEDPLIEHAVAFAAVGVRVMGAPRKVSGDVLFQRIFHGCNGAAHRGAASNLYRVSLVVLRDIYAPDVIAAQSVRRGSIYKTFPAIG